MNRSWYCVRPMILSIRCLPISVQLGACYGSGKGTVLCYFNMFHSLCCLHLPVHHLTMVEIRFSSDLSYFFKCFQYWRFLYFFFPRVNSVELVKKQMRGRESVPAGLWKCIYLFQLPNHNSGSIFNTRSMPNFSLMHEGLGTYVLWEISRCICLHL